MKKVENECVGCDLPCIGDSCSYRKVTRYYCDECGEETTLYHWDGEELCLDCIMNELQVVEGSDC